MDSFITLQMRNDIFDIFRLESIDFSGSIPDHEFLQRIYPLKDYPSNDSRFENAFFDILQHTYNNDDWERDWVFADTRFNLLHCPDDGFMKFLCETVQPHVRRDSLEITKLVKYFNQTLSQSGYSIFVDRYIGNYSVFSYRYISPIDQAIEELKQLTDSLRNSFDDEAVQPTRVDQEQLQIENPPTAMKNEIQVFIIHGHDGHMRESVARLLAKLGLKPVILSEQPGRGYTLIEKFEASSQSNFAIALLSPDDQAILGVDGNGNQITKYRARQNVMLELGYFIGKISRRRVLALIKDPEKIELPSDILGIEYKTMDSAGNWQFEIVKELKAAGIKVDANDLVD